MKTALVISICLTVAIYAIYLALPALLARRGVWMRRRTKFGPALVFESQNADGTKVRLLNVGGTFQSVCYVDDDLRYELACEYHRAMACALLDLRTSLGRPLSVLVIGGGGYSLTKWIISHMPHSTVEVVEIDPAMTQIAREQFYLEDLITEFDPSGDRLKLVCEDGWNYLQADRRMYDVIVNDAFSGNRPLGPMRTDVGARIVCEHLNEGGIYLANVRSALEGKRSKPLDVALEAFSAAFSHVWLVPEWPDKPQERGNNTMIARNGSLNLDIENLRVMQPREGEEA